MKKLVMSLLSGLAGLALAAQTPAEDTVKTSPVLLSLQDALKIAMSENISVKVADMEISRTKYARKGTYAALYPQIDASASFQRTIKKQVMYMDFDLGGASQGSGTGSGTGTGTDTASSSSSKPSLGDGIEVGRSNTWSAGISANMSLVNAQLWRQLKISGEDVELAVEKARASRLEMINQVKQAYFACLLSKEALKVYQMAYDNALVNLELTQKKYNAQKASDLDLTRAKTTLANAVPNLCEAESSVFLSLWQLKAVMGIDLDTEIEVSECLEDYAADMESCLEGDYSLADNTTMRQLSIQAAQLADMVKLQKAAYAPTLGLGFAYSYSAMNNDFVFKEYKWTPYSYVGLNLSIPIFSGGKRRSAVNQARVQASELDLQRINTERQLQISIRQYLNQMETGLKSHDSAVSALQTAQKAYDIASKSYEVGRSTLTDLNDAQYALIQAQMAVNQSVYNYVVAKANLENTLGADLTGEDGEYQLK
ncbi:MAG: TolC family protein [Bacteroidales bacterium]|nr:TolC family protein [Bacteroidales bacterium]